MPTRTDIPARSPLASHWRFDPDIVFLNHGSFGGVPFVVSEFQRSLQLLMQREPIRFVVELMEPMLDQARHDIAPLLGCDADDFAFVVNATMGVNTVVRSLTLKPGDELVTSNHEYNACNNVLDWAAQHWGAKVVKLELPFPVKSSDEMYDTITRGVGPRAKLLLISHITSPSGIILPVERIVAEMNRRGVDTLVDGAHAPGMVPLDIDKLNAPYYTGNFHKWMSAPNGAAFLHVRKDRQQGIRPLIISHGANSTRTDRSRFRLEFDYAGTSDPSPWLSVPVAMQFLPTLAGAAAPDSTKSDGTLPSAQVRNREMRAGWERVMQHNHSLALKGRDILCNALGVTPNATDDMLGSLAAVQLPAATPEHAAIKSKYHDALQDVLIQKHRIQVPIYPFISPNRQVRISGQFYNTVEQYEYLARALKEELGAKGR
ncbi:MAG: aminotransferase class V-fold PLP-dependent enzyme [Pyrinomonadaceae bacterium]|nr:aminotransferase class V-fold PLP-dependent enzyme [Phycisphaerales bacterium]